ncbi:hypothetical protein SNS2_2175 [Streptomyces netropsis]|uniref:Phenylpyruvate tautomerase PptA (4-oxalocrotonate tautomerase family) n=1 Tax=Streptomyces syringium TaxID=76729 RepID=A0ABS4Y6A8_9ACTN|nr:hypothetical protein [Streptomyces syringium]MBP2404090.1 phenylpyruvate tautomerase PptA (4-oxalocrotonate tautomerase family) [Streptomyces syringium]SPE53721.1 hypothetical protein SNS2_2175 [Streptomyces netropsis]
MRITLASTAMAAVCGSLALGVTAPALAAAPETGRATVAHAPSALAETVSVGHRIVREARSASPDAAKLTALQQQLRASAGPLLAPSDPDPLDELRQALDKLIKDVTKIIDEVAQRDAAGTTVAANQFATDLKGVAAKVPTAQKGPGPLAVPVPIP